MHQENEDLNKENDKLKEEIKKQKLDAHMNNVQTESKLNLSLSLGEESVQNGVLITQLEDDFVSNSKTMKESDSLYCPQTKNKKFEVFLEHLSEMSSTQKQKN